MSSNHLVLATIALAACPIRPCSVTRPPRSFRYVLVAFRAGFSTILPFSPTMRGKPKRAFSARRRRATRRKARRAGPMKLSRERGLVPLFIPAKVYAAGRLVSKVENRPTAAAGSSECPRPPSDERAARSRPQNIEGCGRIDGGRLLREHHGRLCARAGEYVATPVRQTVARDNGSGCGIPRVWLAAIA